MISQKAIHKKKWFVCGNVNHSFLEWVGRYAIFLCFVNSIFLMKKKN